MKLKKGVKVISFNTENDKAITTQKINGTWVSNPTIQALRDDGWTDYEEHDLIVEDTYEELVEQYIREHGYPTYGAELAVINNHANDPTAYAQDYADYMTVRDAAKQWAKEQTEQNG